MFLGLSGCFPQFGEYGAGAAGAGAVGGAGGQGGEVSLPECGSEAYCVSRPTGWDGPVALTRDKESCGGAYGREVIAGLTDLDGPPASCGCECGPAAGATCAVTVQRYASAGCVTEFGTPISLTADACATIFAMAAASWRASSTATPGSCPAIDLIAHPEIAALNRRLCATEASTDCPDEAWCAAAPSASFEPRICVYDEGDVECPVPDYPYKVLLFTEGIDDQRGCDAPCACSTPAPTCQGYVNGYQGTTCGTVQDATLVDTCTEGYADSNQSLRYTAMGLVEGNCAPLPRSPNGQVVGLGALTVCCSGAID